MRVTLGADVEFLFIDPRNQQIVPAFNYLRNSGRLGTDANSSLAEVRPRPFEEPKKVVSEFQRIFKSYARTKPEITKFQWRAGSYVGNYPIGGHLHYGFVFEKEDERQPDYRQIVHTLDVYLGSLVLLLEDCVEAVNRRRSYGQLSGYRSQNWGVEYRVLPSFIVNPSITEAVLTIGKVVVSEIANKNGGFVLTPSSLADAYERGSFRTKFVHADKEYFRKWIRCEVMKGLQTFSLYEKYEKVIVEFNKFLMKEKEFAFSQIKDFKGNWGLEEVQIEEVAIRPAEEVWNELQ